MRLSRTARDRGLRFSFAARRDETNEDESSLQSLLFQTRICTLFVTTARRLCKLRERCDKVTWSNAAYIHRMDVYILPLPAGSLLQPRKRRERTRKGDKKRKSARRRERRRRRKICRPRGLV